MPSWLDTIATEDGCFDVLAEETSTVDFSAARVSVNHIELDCALSVAKLRSPRSAQKGMTMSRHEFNFDTGEETPWRLNTKGKWYGHDSDIAPDTHPELYARLVKLCSYSWAPIDWDDAADIIMACKLRQMPDVRVMEIMADGLSPYQRYVLRVGSVSCEVFYGQGAIVAGLRTPATKSNMHTIERNDLLAVLRTHGITRKKNGKFASGYTGKWILEETGEPILIELVYGERAMT